MTRPTPRIASALLAALLFFVWTPGAHADGAVIVPVPIGDVLGESPLNPVSSGMTFEEYQDMHRNLFQGFLYSGIPGGWHFYAGEEKTGWILAGTVVAGIGMIIAGASMAEETGEWASSDYETTELAGQRYARIPTTSSLVGDELTTHFELRPLDKKYKENGSGALIGLGVLALVGSYAYDFLHGVSVIQTKRQRVRFKYGKGMQAGVVIDPRTGEPRVSMKLSF
jgi:hypothetical protein